MDYQKWKEGTTQRRKQEMMQLIQLQPKYYGQIKMVNLMEVQRNLSSE
jgi:hypothetical protein